MSFPLKGFFFLVTDNSYFLEGIKSQHASLLWYLIKINMSFQEEEAKTLEKSKINHSQGSDKPVYISTQILV